MSTEGSSFESPTNKMLSPGLAVKLLRNLDSLSDPSPLLRASSVESKTSGLDIYSSSCGKRTDNNSTAKEDGEKEHGEKELTTGSSIEHDEMADETTGDELTSSSDVQSDDHRPSRGGGGLLDQFTGGSHSTRRHSSKRIGSVEESLGNGVVDALKRYMETQDSPSVTDDHVSTRSLLGPALSSDSPPRTMRVKYSKGPHSPKQLPWLYPYETLKPKKVTYRGYPIDSLKKSKRWKIQIVGSALGPPPEPLPQFPQQELLTSSGVGSYHGIKRILLSEEQILWNSGQKYLHMSGVKSVPTSKSFYTSGYHRGSAVEVTKPFAHSIYDSVVSEATVEVPHYQTA